LGAATVAIEPGSGRSSEVTARVRSRIRPSACSKETAPPATSAASSPALCPTRTSPASPCSWRTACTAQLATSTEACCWSASGAGGGGARELLGRVGGGRLGDGRGGGDAGGARGGDEREQVALQRERGVADGNGDGEVEGHGHREGVVPGRFRARGGSCFDEG